ncbi:CBS domain-containing protein [Virgisporangium aurantiacum]|uniref:Histidine kinase n=1 Tax=Virgisporangium aurantiacum TaxID=175570 RepID=A0A8J3Z0Z3_9ACTN|nr:CBS domain-containing protein [Virgisporangium aurantiacum]GIJ54337.1 histidine kinase [Virgisporangium aurantiacum]
MDETPGSATDPRHRPPIVRDAMRPVVISVGRRAHIAAAAYLMRRAHQTALVVTADDESRRPIGIVTVTDIAQAVADGMDVNEARVEELGGRRPITVRPETSVGDAIALMASAGVRHLPVVEDGQLVGLLDIADAYVRPV